MWHLLPFDATRGMCRISRTGDTRCREVYRGRSGTLRLRVMIVVISVDRSTGEPKYNTNYNIMCCVF
jgi:hypothetical protein